MTRALCTIAVITLVAHPFAARAAEAAIVAGPGASQATYATPVVVHTAGNTMTFANFDIDAHDVVADATRPPGSAPWCPAGGPRCPLFYADLIGSVQTTPVHGLEDLAPGVYLFRCSPHRWMEARLIVF